MGVNRTRPRLAVAPQVHPTTNQLITPKVNP